MSHWLATLMNEGKYAGKQALPADVLKQTLAPSIALPNTMGEARGFWELLNPVYGMGRWTASYRGHQLAFHGGDINGFHSQISMMPQDHVGVIVFVIGDHCASLYNVVSYNVYERLLGMDQTPWSDRMLEARLKGKKAETEGRAKAGVDQVKNTRPSHAIADYAGEFEHPAYGVLRVGMKDSQLQFDFHTLVFPLAHYHFDRFDTPDDEQYGKFSVNFLTNPQGDVDRAVMSLDEAEATFTRKPVTLDRATLEELAGNYETPTGAKFQVVLKEDGSLSLVFAGQPETKLLPYKGLQFHVKEFADVTFEFVVENGQVRGLKQRDPSGEFLLPRK
jgi:hypothetical protein